MQKQKSLLTTPIFTVEHREYTREGKNPVGRDIVVHPGAVVILPLLDDGRLLMIRNYRYTVEQELWELPAGTREPFEETIETARRELVEETGYEAGEMEPLMEFFTSPGILTERMFAFVARNLKPVGQKLEEGEQITVETVEMNDVYNKLINNELIDGKTIAVLSTYFLMNPSLIR